MFIRLRKELSKGFVKCKTKQSDSKWIKVTWLECPLHSNVTSMINNLGEKHIQLSVHWSPLAWETANSHGVASREYHLTVVLPCVGLRRALCAEVVPLTLCVRLNVLKPSLPVRPKSPSSPAPLCVCFGAGLRAPDFWSRDLAVTASDDRGSGEIAPGTPEEAHISGGWETWFNTQNTWALISGFKLFSHRVRLLLHGEGWTFVN